MIVFLSAHGIVEPDRRGYLLRPAVTGAADDLLEPAALDRLLASVAAERTILILDCCFVEALVGARAYLSQLGSDRARLFIASSRATQRTWEEDAAGPGVFTVHLLDLLTIEPELRIALGTILANTPYWRVRPAERGLGIFE